MPKTTTKDEAESSQLPSTLQRSPGKAQRTFLKARGSALDEYGDQQRATRVAWAAVKHSFEKVGDHWERKAGGKRGPSDEQAAGSLDTTKKTRGGVDATATKQHLLELAKKLDIPGRTTMKKDQLVAAIQRANDKRTAKARTRRDAAADRSTGAPDTGKRATGKQATADSATKTNEDSATKRNRGGVDAGATKESLLALAKKLDISGRSAMKKKQLVAAIQKANDKRTAKARTK